MYHQASSKLTAGTRQLVRARAKSRDQLFFFKGYKRDPASGTSVFVTAYFVQVVADPTVFDQPLKEAEEKMNAAKAKVDELQAKIA